jgi:hypothetical protein
MEFIITAHQANLFNFSYHTKGLPAVRKVRAATGALAAGDASQPKPGGYKPAYVRNY